MADRFENVPLAVAEIVKTHGHRVLSTDTAEENEYRLLAFANKLTRAIVDGMTNGNSLPFGNPSKKPDSMK